MVYESVATSICGMNNNEFILTDEQSNRVFHMPRGTTTKARVKSKMHHNLREPTITVDMVPELNHNSLMSARKFVDDNYTTVLNLEEVLIYDGNAVKSRASGKRNTNSMEMQKSGLWRVPLKTKVENENVDTMLLNRLDSGKYINNVYNLPRMEQAIKYLHACAGFPTNAIWLKAIRLGNYTT